MTKTEWETVLSEPVDEDRDHIQGGADAAVTLLEYSRQLFRASGVEQARLPCLFFRCPLGSRDGSLPAAARAPTYRDQSSVEEGRRVEAIYSLEPIYRPCYRTERGSGRPTMPYTAPFCRYRTQEVAGSSPGSSINRKVPIAPYSDEFSGLLPS